MVKRSLATKVLATTLVFSLQAIFLPVIAGPETASISGTVLSSPNHVPLTGVKLHAGDPRTGKIYSSQPTTPDGSFIIEALPAAAYELAVEANGGLYIVDSQVELAPGQAENVYVAVNFEMAASPEEANKKKRKMGIWNNQVTASFIVLASAVLVGELIKQSTEESAESPSEP